jgi:O-antigen/teichoic acid export membrane protein
VNGVMSYVFGKQVNVLMLSTLSKDIEQVAFFDVAYNLMQGVTYATTIGFYGISIATFSRLIIINPEKVSEFWNFLVKITTLLIVPLLIFVVYYSDIIIKFLYTDKYNESVKFFIVYVFFVIITRLLGAGINADIMISSDNVKWLTVFGIISALINVVLNCLLIPKYQGLGAIIGLGGANLIVGILNFSFIRLTLKCRLPLLFWIKVILISIFSIGVCKVIIHSSRTIISSGGTLFLSFIIFYSVFVSLSFIIKLFSAKDKEWLQYIGIIKL